MLISWLNKFTLIDYPWKIACVVFTPGCNLRCKFCHNPEFVIPEEIKKIKHNFISENIFFNFLLTRQWLLDWVSICWWEPSLHKDLKDFCKKIKKLWFLVKLDTNWRDPKLIKELIKEKLVDYFAMDVKATFKNYSNLTQVEENFNNYKKSIELIKNSWIDHEFRTTIIKWYHSEKDIKKISGKLIWAKNYFLQNYRPWKTLESNFDWESFTEKELEEMKKLINPEIENIWIRV